MNLEEIKSLILIWGMISKEAIEQLKVEFLYHKGLYILVPEMRPYLLGLAVSKNLKNSRIRHIYATDNMLGYLFYKNKIKKTLFFYKEITPSGVLGICGSLYACLLSSLHNVPIKLLKGGIESNPLDKDASTINGNLFINDPGLAIEAKDELVPWEILK